MRWVRRLIGLAVVVAFMVGGWRFASENESPIAIRYLIGETELASWQALLGAFGLGFAVTALAWLLFGIRASMVRRRYRKALGRLESEVHQLRNLPLSPDSQRPGDSGAAPSPRMAPEGAGGRSG